MVVSSLHNRSNQDRGEFLDRAVEVVVDHLDIVQLGQLELAAGVGQPPVDRRLVVGPPGPQPALEDSRPGPG